MTEGQSNNNNNNNNNNNQGDLASFGLPVSFGGVNFNASDAQQESHIGPARGRGRGRGRGGHEARGRGRGRGRGGGFAPAHSRPQQHPQNAQWQPRGGHFNDNDDDPSLAFDRPAQSFFKPSFLKDPWAHLS